jgi:predicted aspartyl protease
MNLRKSEDSDLTFGTSSATQNTEIELLVDSESVYTWIQKASLEELGIKSEGERSFKTIEGRIIKRAIGMGIIECAGRRAPTVLVFAEGDDAQVLGVHALEGLGLELDPTTKQLRKVEAILAV